ncbi:hypothetical protein CesoFtcFv8_027520 [Champsocephalus esox]|uniref:Secreted protein n=1 Tax=Champsocephalus esox TaxID=159716 RepID=A0AAN7YF33_9TELE|nr:hypothetical protein CesoFtcFv8_027520 [Champsocephalus esox]
MVEQLVLGLLLLLGGVSHYLHPRPFVSQQSQPIHRLPKARRLLLPRKVIAAGNAAGSFPRDKFRLLSPSSTSSSPSIGTPFTVQSA